MIKRSLVFGVTIYSGLVLAAMPITDLPSPPESLRQSLVPQTTAESPLRRADVILFIALPFAILWNTLTQTILNQLVGWRGDILNQKSPGGPSLFVFNERGVRSDMLFIAFSSILWSGTIAWNDYLETHHPAQAQTLKDNSGPLGLDLHLLRVAF